MTIGCRVFTEPNATFAEMGRTYASAVSLLVAVVVVIAAGCGGDSETKKANREWANAVCTSVGVWKKQVHGSYTSLNPTFSPNERLHQAIGATQLLVTQLKNIGLPDTKQGQEAQQQLEKTADDLQTQLDQIESSAKELESGNTAGAKKLLGQLDALTRSLVASLKGLRSVVSSDLAVALATTKACRDLGD